MVANDYAFLPLPARIAGPGKSPDGRLLVDLIHGETYLLFCNFKDSPDAPTHMTLGMYATFRPQYRFRS